MEDDRHRKSFMTMLRLFHQTGVGCDATITVENKTFKCQRIVLMAQSEYFYELFEKTFEQPDFSHSIPEMNAYIFEKILQFVYTGKVDVTRENVTQLYHASIHLKFTSIKEQCHEFIKRYLNDIINSEPLFQLSHEHLELILSYKWFLSVDNEQNLCEMIRRWVNRDRQNREKYLDKLLAQIDVRNFTPDYVEFIVKKYAGEYSEPVCKRGRLSKDSTGLCMVFENNEKKTTTIYTAQKSAPQWTKSNLHYRNSFSITNISVSDQIFCLYCLDKPSSDGHHLQRFRRYRCVNKIISSSSSHALKPPPVRVKARHLNLCHVHNSIIYLSNSSSWYAKPKLADSSCTDFSDEEIEQGVYSYHIAEDRWYPLPLLPETLVHTTRPIITYNDVLYLVGRLSVLAFDHRATKWQKVGRTISELLEKNTSVQCCVLNGDIYVCSNGTGVRIAEISRYDIVASKWETIPRTNQNYKNYKLLPHENLVWAFGRVYAFGQSENSDFNIEVFNPRTQKWSPSPVTDVTSTLSHKKNEFMDAFIHRF